MKEVLLTVAVTFIVRYLFDVFDEVKRLYEEEMEREIKDGENSEP